MYCKKCHYPLEGLGQEQCPECGRTFSSSDPRTFDRYASGPMGWKSGWQWVIWQVALAASGLSILGVCFDGYDLLCWHYSRAAGGGVILATKGIGNHEKRFGHSGGAALLSLGLTLVSLRRCNDERDRTIIRVTRSMAFAAATWWIGWYLAIHYGYLLFPLYPTPAYTP